MSITLPIKECIMEGLSCARTSNLLKVLTYNIIIDVIAFFAHCTTCQFCAFVIVVLVAHWFLVHTFFVAVLSIDLQQLEFEELLQQNASFTPSAWPIMLRQTAQPNGRNCKFMTTLQGLLCGCVTKNISLLLVQSLIIYLPRVLIMHVLSAPCDNWDPLFRNIPHKSPF